MDAGHQDPQDGDVWANLVEGVLDTHSDEATRRFDVELAAAVADGAVTDDAARRLRFWQRASVRGVVDHAGTVLPATLRAIETARQQDRRHVEKAERLTSAGDEPGWVPSGVEARSQTTAGDENREASRHARRASPAGPAQPRTLEERRPRLLVADLTDAAQDGAR